MHSAITTKILALAQARVGRGIYRGKATLDQAPEIVNCFTFIQWIWREAGVIVPDHILAWDRTVVIARADMRPCDLVFAPRLNRTLETDDFGHIGIVGYEGWIIHASRVRGAVGADSPARFFERGCLGVRRILIA
jgi:cell wall-associated NlpC family hydrolase